MKIFVIFLALVLTGCAQQIAERHHNTCTSYGFQVGTPDYGSCRLALQQMRQQRYATAVQNYNNSLALQRSISPQRMTTTCRQQGVYMVCN